MGSLDGPRHRQTGIVEGSICDSKAIARQWLIILYAEGKESEPLAAGSSLDKLAGLLSENGFGTPRGPALPLDKLAGLLSENGFGTPRGRIFR